MTEPDTIEADIPETARQEGSRGLLAVSTFLIGNGISMVGNTLVLVALPWFVLETTGSAARTGLVGMAAALPALLSGMLGGILVDRLGGRAMSVISDIISGVAVILIPILYLTTGLDFWMLLLLVFIGAALDIPGVTARRTLLPDLSQGARIRPEAISSAYETMQATSFIIGPAIAGVLIALIGTVNLLWITAGGFFVSAACIGLFAPAGKHVAEAESPHAASGAIAELKAGLRYLRTDQVLFSLAIGLTLMNFLNGPFWSVVLPVLVSERFGQASQLGLMFTALGVGGVLGGIFYGWMGHRFRSRRRLSYLSGVTAFCALVWVAVAGASFPVMLGCVFLAGLISGPINPMLVTVRLERIPEALRGRVFATFSGLAAAAIPLGMLLAGWLLEIAGLSMGLLVLALVTTTATVGLWMVQPFKEMNIPDSVAPRRVSAPSGGAK